MIGTGSEVGVAVDAAALLEKDGIHVNVVSMPSWERFNSLTTEQRNSIIPSGLPSISVEAGSTFGWRQYATHSVGIDRFGASAPGGTVMKELGITPEHVAAVVKSSLN